MKGKPPERIALMQRWQWEQWPGHPGCPSGRFMLRQRIYLHYHRDFPGTKSHSCRFHSWLLCVPGRCLFICNGTKASFHLVIWSEQKKLRDESASSPKPREIRQTQKLQSTRGTWVGSLGHLFLRTSSCALSLLILTCCPVYWGSVITGPSLCWETPPWPLADHLNSTGISESPHLTALSCSAFRSPHTKEKVIFHFQGQIFSYSRL